jgi:D-alanyl-D-alanine carboxypeptidase
LVKSAVAGLAVTAFGGFASRGTLAADTLTPALDQLLQTAVAGGIPGMVLYVERGGKPIYQGAAGFANIESKTEVKVSDRQRIYSITKLFTSIVTLQLVDEGVLSLDDTVTKWLDDPAVLRIPNIDQITLRQLLVHTSGIYDFADDNDSSFWLDAFLGPNADWSKVWTPMELIAYADGAKHAPYFAPGEGYFYSNTNFILVGLIIEKETGQKFSYELKKRILTPLALNDTFFVEGRELPEGTVNVYQSIDGQLMSLSQSNIAWAWTFGGMVSTPEDIARFSHAVYGGELLKPSSFKVMFDFFPAKHEGYYEGIGVYKTDSPSGQLTVSDGTGPGANSTLTRFEPADLTVIMIDNVAPDGGATEILRDEVVKIVLANS